MVAGVEDFTAIVGLAGWTRLADGEMEFLFKEIMAPKSPKDWSPRDGKCTCMRRKHERSSGRPQAG